MPINYIYLFKIIFIILMMNKNIINLKFLNSINKLNSLTSLTKSIKRNFSINSSSSQNFNFYNVNKFCFARNNVKKNKFPQMQIIPDEELPSNKTSNNLTPNTENDIIPLEIEFLKDIITTFYKRGKEYQLEGTDNTLTFKDNESYVKIYEFITNNLKHIKEENSFSELVRAISYFKIKDEKTSEIFTKFLSSNPDINKKSRNSCIVIYTMMKINFTDENLLKKCFQFISEGSLDEAEKQVVIPFVWALSEKEISIKEINEKIDDYVKFKINDFSEYDLSLVFRFYSKLFNFNYEVLEILIKKCLEFCPTLSLRYILIITKCLAEMNIRNLNLLTGIQERLLEIIKMNEKYITDKQVDHFNLLTPDYIAQVLANLVQIEFIEFEDFNKFENLFFELAEKVGISNRETIYSIISTHCKYMKKMFYEINAGDEDKKENSRNSEEIDNIKKYEKNINKTKQNSIRNKKAYKLSNEIFYEKIVPYILNFKDDINFHTTFNLFVIFKNSHITKRKILRSLIDFYVLSLNKFLTSEKIKKQDKHKVDVLIKCGLDLFDYEAQRTLIFDTLKELNVNTEKYVKYYQGKKTKKEGNTGKEKEKEKENFDQEKDN